MMHDLSLGPPVAVGVTEGAKHSGPCFDGVYGCHICWNAENDGNGTVSDCDGCNAKNVHTLIVRGIDEPTLYAACEACRGRRGAYLRELEEEYDDLRRWEDDE